MDEERILNIPNLGYKPEMFSIGTDFDDQAIKMNSIKNIRVNEGGKKLYDRILAEGKFVTTGILFEVNKTNITPESMGTINEIVNLMKEHSDLKFSIEGHTDSDGDKTYNQKLSEDRAKAVKNLLENRVSMQQDWKPKVGVTANRLVAMQLRKEKQITGGLNLLRFE